MRILRPTQLTAALAAAAIGFVAGACMAPATIASAAGSRCAQGTEDAVSTAYDQVFTRSLGLTAEQRAASLAQGDDPALRAVLDAWLASPAPSSSTITVNGIECRGRSRVVVDGDLNLAGVPLPGVLPPSRAVRDNGTWKVARSTFCYRMVLENPSLANSGVCERNTRANR